MKKSLGVRAAILAVLSAAVVLGISATASAVVIKVTTTADDYGMGVSCSLREAITAANGNAAFGGCTAGSGPDEIRLAAGAVYARSIDGNGEDGNATGDLDVTSRMSIGPLSGKAMIDANTFDRVLDVSGGGVLDLHRTTITGASETYPPAVIDGTGIKVRGGAVLRTSRVLIVGNQTLGNSANNGGGLLLSGGHVTLDRTTVKGNTAGNVGGGIAMYSGHLRIKRSSIVGNHSGYLGGGVYLGGDLVNPDSAVITDSTISGNEADADGGGINVSIYGDGATLTNVTISGNRSATSGGGIFQYTGTVDLNSVTITRNTADDDASGTGHGGGIAGGAVNYVNSILAGNFDLNPVSPMADCDGSGSLGHNVIGASCTASQGDKTANPKVGPLRRNGGPTKTHALRHGSSAIGLADKSSAPRRDQRGVRRDGDPDSGAFERG